MVRPPPSITGIRPFHVAGYIQRLQGAAGAPRVKQELAAIRTLFDWLVLGSGTADESARGGPRTDSCCERLARPRPRRQRVMPIGATVG